MLLYPCLNLIECAHQALAEACCLHSSSYLRHQHIQVLLEYPRYPLSNPQRSDLQDVCVSTTSRTVAAAWCCGSTAYTVHMYRSAPVSGMIMYGQNEDDTKRSKSHQSNKIMHMHRHDAPLMMRRQRSPLSQESVEILNLGLDLGMMFKHCVLHCCVL